jgi:hypothetical protein
VVGASRETAHRRLNLARVSNAGNRARLCHSFHSAISSALQQIHLRQHWRQFCVKEQSCALAPNQRFIGWTERKCEPVYTNRAACVALWTRQTRQPTILRGLRLFQIGLEIAYVRWQWVQGVASFTGYQAVFNDPLWKPARLNAHPIRPPGLTFKKNDIPS